MRRTSERLRGQIGENARRMMVVHSTAKDKSETQAHLDTHPQNRCLFHPNVFISDGILYFNKEIVKY